MLNSTYTCLSSLTSGIPPQTRSDTGITPFETEHVMSMLTIAQSLTENPPPEGLPADANNLTTIAQSCKAYQQLLANVTVVKKVIATLNLNERGLTKITYRVNDRVTLSATLTKAGANPPEEPKAYASICAPRDHNAFPL